MLDEKNSQNFKPIFDSIILELKKYKKLLFVTFQRLFLQDEYLVTNMDYIEFLSDILANKTLDNLQTSLKNMADKKFFNSKLNQDILKMLTKEMITFYNF